MAPFVTGSLIFIDNMTDDLSANLKRNTIFCCIVCLFLSISSLGGTVQCLNRLGSDD